jgi:2-haloacid dehalogenase
MKQGGTMKLPKALAFDVFGTVVDWRSGIAREAAPVLAALGRGDIDPSAFADRWRAKYQPAMAAVRSGARPFMILDMLHRETLEEVFHDLNIDLQMIGEQRLADLNLAWHRLDPWPDAVAGLTRLRAKYPIVTLSNGNVALMVDMARRAGLPWDAILGAEHSRHYKPDPEAYLATARTLAILPEELCLVAAHHSDLAAARDCGLLAAYVDRPLEYGGRPAPDARFSSAWEWSAGSLTELAAALGA